MDFYQPPVVRVVPAAESRLPADEWPANIPAVEQLLRDGLDLPAGVTFLVGENGSGKSTLVEAIAMAFGLSPEGAPALTWPFYRGVVDGSRPAQPYCSDHDAALQLNAAPLLRHNDARGHRRGTCR